MLLFTLTFLAFVWLYAMGEQKTHTARTERSIEFSVLGVSHDLVGVSSDLKLLAGSFNLRQWLDQGSADTLYAVQQDMLSLAQVNPLFDQVRFLDAKGMERVRVDQNNGHPSLRPDDTLQDKSRRYYFKDAIVLPPGTLYLSPLDLNVEQGVVERPFKPMLHFAEVVLDSAGRKRGVVLINYLAKTFLDRAVDSMDTLVGEAMLFNQDGYWFHAPLSTDEWGFMFGEEITFPNRYPDAWKEISKRHSGMVDTDDGRFLFHVTSPVEPRHAHGERLSIDTHRHDGSGKLFWGFAVKMDPNPLSVLSRSFWFLAAFCCFLCFFVLAAGCWLLAKALVKQTKEETKTRKLAAMVENNTSLMLLTDQDGIIEYVNAKFTGVTGFSSEEVIGQTPRVLRSGNQPQVFYQNFWRTILAGKVWQGELHNRRKDGSDYWAATTIVPLFGADRCITHFFASSI